MCRAKPGEANAGHMVEIAHELNRHLFDGNGNAFVILLADYIRDHKIVLSKEALDFLFAAVESARRR